MQGGLWRSVIAVLAFAFLAGAAPVAAADFDLAKLKDGGYVVLLRHVKAGGSDADNFDLENCGTQRQVGAPGRKQAAMLSERFRAAGISEVRILSSQYCRARQTAELLDLGPVTAEPRLNYFHWRTGDEAAMVSAFQSFLQELEAAGAQAPLVVVTHKHAFVEVGVPEVKSGGGVILKPNGSAKPDVVGRITAP
ncbi:histidine phosphatase family protein [Pelagibius litoralis]|uniref:Histidine phosphatase family protein n=1 Tax=Pelagibius litoralis TaxID=374515 RepID=A0A967KDU4_9PROT|nr:histidine phosphatase family protein [Pelagibius litoralis]NIA72462.1 histidine phosphatase family protein [Pelagibius litoralis]